MSAVIYPPVDPPQVLETLCLELRDCCEQGFYLRWKDVAGGFVHWNFCAPYIEGINTKEGDKFEPYVYDVQENDRREGIIEIQSNVTYRCFSDEPLDYAKILSKSLAASPFVQVYQGTYLGIEQWVAVRITGITKGNFKSNQPGLYKLEVEFELQRQFNLHF
jgi:hypothetical protein